MLIFQVVYSVLNNTLGLQNFDIPIAIPTILGTSISLIIGFRINQAYQRWWEARMVWGEIANESRGLIRQLIGYLPKLESTAEELFIFTKRQVFFCYVLTRILRGQSTQDLKEYLLVEDAEEIYKHKNIANAALLSHTKQLSIWHLEGKINDFQQIEVDLSIKRLGDAMGKTERIKNTIFPTTFSIFVRMFVYLFIFFLPFGLNNFLGLEKIPIVIVISIAFLLLEKSAEHLQNPFSYKPQDTPMLHISNKVERNLYDMLGKYDEKLHADDGVRSFYTL